MRLSGLIFLFAAVCLGCGLFVTSQSVQRVEMALHDVERDIKTETENVRVLSTEWVYLNKPQRLEKLAYEYLRVEGGGEHFVGSGFDWEKLYFENAIKVPPTPELKPVVGKRKNSVVGGGEINDLLQRVTAGEM